MERLSLPSGSVHSMVSGTNVHFRLKVRWLLFEYLLNGGSYRFAIFPYQKEAEILITSFNIKVITSIHNFDEK